MMHLDTPRKYTCGCPHCLLKNQSPPTRPERATFSRAIPGPRARLIPAQGGARIRA